MSRDVLKGLAEEALEKALEVTVEIPPAAVLLMARVRETVNGDRFNLGEVLMTRCELTLDGEPGWGMVAGDDPERAVCAAILDAASRKEDLFAGLEGELALQLAFVREARRERWARVQPTRVEFEEMPT